jgi:peptidyl-prolyl cis-trans isomerase SurA
MKKITPGLPLSFFRCITPLLGLLLLSSTGNTAPRKLPVLDRVVAIVNQEAIPESELNNQMTLLMLRLKQSETALPPLAQLRKQLLDKLVIEKLQLQKAKEAHIEIDEPELNKAIAELAARDDFSVDELQQFLGEQGLPFNKFRETIKNEITISKLQQREVGQNIHISPLDVEQFLASAAGQDQTGAEYHLGHILIALPETASAEEIAKSKKQAEGILQRLRSGADFAQTAVGESSGAQALKGGDLGWRKMVEIPTLFSNVVSTLKIGELHGPIRNDSGFHIIKLIDKRIDGKTATDITSVKKIHVRQILIKTASKMSDAEAQALLLKLRGQILSGEDFPKLALKYSQETQSASKGGDLGWVSPSTASLFFEKISILRPGEVSQPFKTDKGWHLVQVIEHRIGHTASEPMKTRATDLLFQRKFEERLVSWLRRLRDEAEVQIYLNDI